jgi:hypothetical protein
MPHYMVFQQRLTDEQIDAVNLGQSRAEATAYFKLLSLNEAMAQKRVDVANRSWAVSYDCCGQCQRS